MDAYGIIRIFGVVVLLAGAPVQCSKINERMPEDEIANISHMTGNRLSQSDVASVRSSRYKRSGQDLPNELTASGKKINDYMYSSDGQLFGADTPVWYAFPKRDGTVGYTKMRKGIVETVVCRLYTGHFAPYSEKEKEDCKNEKMRRNGKAPNANRTILDALHNVTANSTSVSEEEIRQLESEIRDASRSDNWTDAFNVDLPPRKTIYPTVLVMTDFQSSKRTHNDLNYYDEIVYQLAFWTAVDLRFRQFNNPKVRLRIAGIIIGQNRLSTPYLQSGDRIKMWNEMQRYWWKMGQHEDFPHNAYHIVVTMTEIFSKSGSILEGMTVKSNCGWIRNDKFHTVAIVRDNGGFEGILKAARTLGHLLGLDHDKDSGDECDNSNGFIMQSGYVTGPKNLEWSPCSLTSLSSFFMPLYMQCYDKPAEFYPPGRPLPIVLPGSVWGREKQCQGRDYDFACDSIPDMCGQLQCSYSRWKWFYKRLGCQNTGPAAEGTKCAPGHKCVNGVCQCMTDECIFIY